MANTIADRVYRDKYRSKNLDIVLRNALVSEKIFQVDRTDAKRIQSPYGSQGTATVHAIGGTYAIAEYQNTDDTLTVVDQISLAEHIYDFEEVLTMPDIFASRVDEQAYAVAVALDKYVLNNILEAGTGTYSTPSGGFTTAANINTIMGNLVSKVAGYADAYNGLFLVIENTDLVGFAIAGATNGFSMADAVLKNGFMNTWMGVDIYVVRSGTFDDEANSSASGTTTWTNDGHRMFGVKNVATYASPRGVRFEEKPVTGKTGMEVVTYCYVGAKLWAVKAGLIVDITLTA